jgi:hypothetical protein
VRENNKKNFISIIRTGSIKSLSSFLLGINTSIFRNDFYDTVHSSKILRYEMGNA